MNRFPKRMHASPSKSIDTAEDIANQFFQKVFQLYGLSCLVVSNFDPNFTSIFFTAYQATLHNG